MDPILLDLGFIKIYWYSVCILLGFLLGGYLLLKETRRFKMKDDLIINMFFYTIPIAIIGARLYYVIFSFDMYKDNLLDIFKVWEGGLAIHGGVLFGLIFIIYYTRKHKLNTLKIMDISAISLIVGQIIGRWGNFFNGEAHGPVTSLARLKSLHLPNFIIEGMHIEGNYYHPTFLYESVFNLIGLIIMLILRRRKFLRNGQLAGFYMIWYGIGRFLIEILRTDALMFGNIKVAQVISIILIISGLILILRGFKKEEKYNSIGG